MEKLIIGVVCFIIGLLFGYLMDAKPIIIRKFVKDSSGVYGTSRKGSVNDDLA
jgi:hypothetical protein